MGRPIKKQFFGNTITTYKDHATGGKTGVGGEGVLSISISNTGTNYSKGTTVSFATPNVTGGIRATGHPVFGWGPSGFGISSIVIDNPGSGYTSAPVMTVTKAPTITSTTNSGLTATNTFTVSSVTGIAIGMLIAGAATGSAGYVTAINGNVISSTVNNNGPWTNAANLTFTDNGASFAKTVNLTSGRPNAISFASTLTGGTVRTTGDILKQESSRRYLIQNTDGKGVCKLVAKANADLLAGEMNIIATDYNGNTYFVTKLTARKARLEQYVNNEAAWLVDDGGVAGWTIGAATTTRVSIAHTI